MLRRGLLNTRRAQYLLPVRGKFPGLNEKEVFSFEPEFWEVAGAPPEQVESDPTTGWTQDSRRVGTLAQKVGMIHEFDDWMSFIPLTVLFVRGALSPASSPPRSHAPFTRSPDAKWPK